MLRYCLPITLLMPALALADAKKPTFDEDVMPILKQSCIICHSNDKQKGGLNMATFAATMQGGSSGVVVAAGNPDKSRLFTMSAHKEEPVMPPSKQKIPDAQIEVLRLWVEQGARENLGSKIVAVKPKTDIGLKSVVKGRPEGPPPMPAAGKLKIEPILKARRPGAVLAMAASPWAPLLAIGGQKQITLLNSDTGDTVGHIPFEHGQINDLKFSRNGRLLIAAGGRGGQSGKAVLYNVETGEKITEVGIETDAILAADISADQTQIAVGSSSKLIRIYSTADGSVLREIKKHTDWICAVEFSPDGVLLATGDRNGGLFVWESYTGREYFSLRGHTAMITDVSWRDDSNSLASSSEDTTIKTWEMENGNLTKNWAAHPGGAASVRFSHDSRLVSTGRDKITKLWDQNGGLQRQFEAFADLGLRVAIAHDNAKVFAGDWAGIVKGWIAADGRTYIVADTNPKTVAEQILLAQQALAASDAKLAQTIAALAAAKVNTDKANAELAPFQKVIVDLTVAAAAAKVASEASVTAAAVATNATVVAQAITTAKTTGATVFQEAAAKLLDAANKNAANAELKIQAKKAADIAKVAADELAAANKLLADSVAAQKVAMDKVPVAAKAVVDAAAKVPVAQAALVAQQAARKPVFDAFNAAQVVVNGATAEVVAAKAKLDKLKPPVVVAPVPAPVPVTLKPAVVAAPVPVPAAAPPKPAVVPAPVPVPITPKK